MQAFAFDIPHNTEGKKTIKRPLAEAQNQMSFVKRGRQSCCTGSTLCARGALHKLTLCKSASHFEGLDPQLSDCIEEIAEYPMSKLLD